jgi:hypothetical protein
MLLFMCNDRRCRVKDWRGLAACANAEAIEVLDKECPSKSDRSSFVTGWCATCPVLLDCAKYAQGISPDQRAWLPWGGRWRTVEIVGK